MFIGASLLDSVSSLQQQLSICRSSNSLNTLSFCSRSAPRPLKIIRLNCVERIYSHFLGFVGLISVPLMCLDLKFLQWQPLSKPLCFPHLQSLLMHFRGVQHRTSCTSSRSLPPFSLVLISIHLQTEDGEEFLSDRMNEAVEPEPQESSHLQNAGSHRSLCERVNR